MVEKAMSEKTKKELEKSYRQMVKERPDEYSILIRLFELPPASMLNIFSTGLANFKLCFLADNEKAFDELFAMLKKDTFDKIEKMKELKIEKKTKEICTLCEKPFVSDGSGEVPICMPCLVGYTPKAKEQKP